MSCFQTETMMNLCLHGYSWTFSRGVEVSLEVHVYNHLTIKCLKGILENSASRRSFNSKYMSVRQLNVYQTWHFMIAFLKLPIILDKM